MLPFGWRFLPGCFLGSAVLLHSLAFAGLDSYSYAQLDALWQSGLGRATGGPDVAWYGLLAEAVPEINRPAGTLTPKMLSHPTRPVEDEEERLPERSAFHVIGVEPAASEKAGARRYFTIARPPAAAESKALRRLVDARIYLSRQGRYSGGGSASESKALLQRYRSALVENELGAMLQFFAEPTLIGKCRAAGSILQIQTAGTPAFKADGVLPAWSGALSLLQTVQSRLNWADMRSTLCRIRPILGRADVETRARLGLLSIIKKRVEALGRDEVVMVRPKANPVTGEVPAGLVPRAAPLVLMRAQREYLTETENRVRNVDIPLADASATPGVADMGILSLRRHAGNVETNLNMARVDTLCGANCPTGLSLLNQLKSIKLDNPNLKGLADDPTLPHKQGKKELDGLKVELDEVISSLGRLARDLPAPYRSRVTTCSNLSLPWPATAQDQNRFSLALDSCLKGVKQITGELQTLNDQDELDREFARRTMQISQKILQRLTRSSL